MATGTSVLKLVVDDKEYGPSIKNAKLGMQALQESLQKAGKSFGNIDGKITEYVRAIGQMETTSKSAKGTIGEMSAAFVDLSMQYKHMTDQEKQSPPGKALAESLDKLKNRVIEAKKDLADFESQLKDIKVETPSGGLFGGDSFKGMLQVFGGNLLTKAAGMVADLGGEVVNLVGQANELAKSAEGVQMAFERLNRPDLLDKLKEATHGTVTELELMRQAVKFNDFRLNLDEMGTLLAFAQQKAKDTGQSVDYMVESIVTGLGRQSLMILDNLGLSASEIKERMKETGDMTTAVAAIIRDQMAKAGDYVETVADRTARANAELEDKLLELGNVMQQTFGVSGVSEMATAIKSELVGALTFTIETINEAKEAWQGLLQTIGLAKKEAKPEDTAPRPNHYDSYEVTTDADGNVVSATKWNRGKAIDMTTQARLQQGITVTGSTDKQSGSSGRTGGRKAAETFASDSIAYQEKQVQELTKKWREAGAAVRDDYAKQLGEAKQTLSEMQGGFAPSNIRDITKAGTPNLTQGAELTLPVKLEIQSPEEKLREEAKRLTDMLSEAWSDTERKAIKERLNSVNADIDKMEGMDTGRDDKKLTAELSKLTSGLSQITGGLKQIGIDVPQEVDRAISIIQGLTSVIEGVQTVISLFSTTAMTANTAAIVANTAALTFNSATNFVPLFAHGGIVPHAAGGWLVPGNDHADRTLIAASSGELILNRAQQGNLASQLEGGMGNLHVTGKLAGHDLLISIDRTARIEGKGEMVFWHN